MEAFEIALGLLLVALVFWDAFETIVVPRPTPGWFRLGRYLVRGAWRVVRPRRGAEVGATRDKVLGLFAPASIIVLLVAWLAGLILGYGLILFGLRDELQPAPPDLGAALYFAASSILTLGFGDIVAVGAAARVVVVAAAASGLGVVALVITFLFSLYGSYQRRELSVVLLQAKAGVPPSAVVLLESVARMDLVGRLPDFFGEWERWTAEVLDSHVAYPLLGFFRSSHDNLSWISALGTVLDAASLVLTTILDVPWGQAELVISLGSHLVEDISNLGFRAGDSIGLDRPAFDAVCARLVDAGYRLAPLDEAWQAFSATRASYAPRLEAMAAYWAVSSASWFGGSEPLRSPTHRRPDPAARIEA
ncbi:MAG: ion channel [Candidatus Limnocylindrales bacterium]